MIFSPQDIVVYMYKIFKIFQFYLFVLNSFTLIELGIHFFVLALHKVFYFISP